MGKNGNPLMVLTGDRLQINTYQLGYGNGRRVINGGNELGHKHGNSFRERKNQETDKREENVKGIV